MGSFGSISSLPMGPSHDFRFFSFSFDNTLFPLVSLRAIENSLSVRAFMHK
jgi:hypothetical protein